MNPKLAIRIGTDFAMFAVLFMLMGYSITGNAIHEWMGIALAVLFGIHISLNFAWVKSIAKGRYTAKRTAGTVINVLMFVATIVTIVSAIPIFGYGIQVYTCICRRYDNVSTSRLGSQLDVRTHRHTSRYAVEQIPQYPTQPTSYRQTADYRMENTMYLHNYICRLRCICSYKQRNIAKTNNVLFVRYMAGRYRFPYVFRRLHIDIHTVCYLYPLYLDTKQ